MALLFDMNMLWEEYVLIKLKQACQDTPFKVYGQNSKGFWNGITIRPDIVVVKNLEDGEKEILIIDTKWKNINEAPPSTHDLRQMYVYNEYWRSKKSLLLYPSNQSDFNGFVEFERISEEKHHQCGLGKISVIKGDGSLDAAVGRKVLDLFL